MTSEDYTRDETTIFWTFDTRKWKTKTTDGRKDRRDKTHMKAKNDLDKRCDGLVCLSYTKCVRTAETIKEWSSMADNVLRRRWHLQ